MWNWYGMPLPRSLPLPLAITRQTGETKKNINFLFTAIINKLKKHKNDIVKTATQLCVCHLTRATPHSFPQKHSSKGLRGGYDKKRWMGIRMMGNEKMGIKCFVPPQKSPFQSIWRKALQLNLRFVDCYAAGDDVGSGCRNDNGNGLMELKYKLTDFVIHQAKKWIWQRGCAAPPPNWVCFFRFGRNFLFCCVSLTGPLNI